MAAKRTPSLRDVVQREPYRFEDSRCAISRREIDLYDFGPLFRFGTGFFILQL